MKNGILPLLTHYCKFGNLGSDIGQLGNTYWEQCTNNIKLDYKNKKLKGFSFVHMEFLQNYLRVCCNMEGPVTVKTGFLAGLEPLLTTGAGVLTATAGEAETLA